MDLATLETLWEGLADLNADVHPADVQRFLARLDATPDASPGSPVNKIIRTRLAKVCQAFPLSLPKEVLLRVLLEGCESQVDSTTHTRPTAQPTTPTALNVPQSTPSKVATKTAPAFSPLSSHLQSPTHDSHTLADLDAAFKRLSDTFKRSSLLVETKYSPSPPHSPPSAFTKVTPSMLEADPFERGLPSLSPTAYSPCPSPIKRLDGRCDLSTTRSRSTPNLHTSSIGVPVEAGARHASASHFRPPPTYPSSVAVHQVKLLLLDLALTHLNINRNFESISTSLLALETDSRKDLVRLEELSLDYEGHLADLRGLHEDLEEIRSMWQQHYPSKTKHTVRRVGLRLRVSKRAMDVVQEVSLEVESRGSSNGEQQSDLEMGSNVNLNGDLTIDPPLDMKKDIQADLAVDAHREPQRKWEGQSTGRLPAEPAKTVSNINQLAVAKTPTLHQTPSQLIAALITLLVLLLACYLAYALR